MTKQARLAIFKQLLDFLGVFLEARYGKKR